MNKIFLPLLFTVILFSCKKSSTTDMGVLAEQTSKDVAYATSSPQQKMDVYLPANRSTSTTYIVIMVHGGSWSAGDKTDFDTYIPNLKPLLGNYAIFNINYRLANGSTVLLQQQIDDINTAIDFITSKANEYNVNTSKMALMGASAGAHLTLLKAFRFKDRKSVV